MFLLVVITTHSLRFNTNLLLQLDLHMEILVCIYVRLPSSFSLSSCKTLAQDDNNFCIQLCCEQQCCDSIFSIPLEVLQGCLTQCFLKTSSYISTNLTVTGYYICKQWLTNVWTLNWLAKDSLLYLMQIFHCCASAFKQYCAKEKLRSGTIPLSERVSRSGNPWLITQGDVYNSNLSYTVTLWVQSMRFPCTLTMCTYADLPGNCRYICFLTTSLSWVVQSEN